MKHFLLSVLIAGILSIPSFSQANYTRDSTTMGASYAYDVYYSMSQGTVSTVLRANWDLAFRAFPTSASILVNEGAGSALWAYPGGDYSAWSTVDTAGLSTWTPLYNSDKDWEEGAFNRNAQGHPDYGWGSYNAVTHNVVGDSIFILKTFNGPFKKVAIISKQSLAMIYTFRVANLDGSGDTTVVLDAAPYNTKNFVYFDASTNGIVDREPVSADWDLVWRRYYAELDPGVFYPVVGVQNNYSVTIARYAEADTSSLVWDFPDFSPEISGVGHTWKAINMSTFQWDIDDSLFFLVKARNGDLYKLVFESFTGTGTGKSRFRKALISPAGINDLKAGELRLFPVPATSELNVLIPQGFESATLKLHDLNGRLLYQNVVVGETTMRIDVSSLTAGMYIIRLEGPQGVATSKFLKN